MEFEIDKDFALFYGIMLGDGCLSLVRRKDKRFPRKMIVISGSSKDDLPFFQNVIMPILIKLRGKETKIKFKKDCNAIEIILTDENLFYFMNSLGFPVGKKGDKLFIPKVFYEKNLVEDVINGFFATDGSLVLTKNPNKYYPRLEIHVISKNLLQEVYSYLSNIGLNGAFYDCKRIDFSNDSYKWCYPHYRVQFNGKNNLLLFENKIGFCNPKYKEKFDNFMKYDSEYIPLNRMAAPRIALGTPSS